ncbi:MAG: hypothetical protein IPI90_15655 [Saprospiraceae bacterium]|nr:hypothetical protein [Candidatus Vicinibacter affinis]
MMTRQHLDGVMESSLLKQGIIPDRMIPLHYFLSTTSFGFRLLSSTVIITVDIILYWIGKGKLIQSGIAPKSIFG